MSFLTIQRQITQLRRERAELSARLYVHALADEDPEALTVYRRLQDLDSEIYGLEQVQRDRLLAGYLAQQGAAAVEFVERYLSR